MSCLNRRGLSTAVVSNHATTKEVPSTAQIKYCVEGAFLTHHIDECCRSVWLIRHSSEANSALLSDSRQSYLIIFTVSTYYLFVSPTMALHSLNSTHLY